MFHHVTSMRMNRLWSFARRPRIARPSRSWRCVCMLLMLACLLWQTSAAQAVQIQDIVRLKGSEPNRLVGFGLVVGLRGTGDGKLPSNSRAMAEAISKFVDANVVAAELSDAKNVALVSITAELPAHGVREGDLVDVKIASVHNARSLEGGRLLLTPLVGPGPNPPVLAFAEGDITIENDNVPTVARVKNGAQLTVDIMTQLMDRWGRITLVINDSHAGWPVSRNIAEQINGLLSPDGPSIARAVDQKNVVIQVPMWERENPAAFVSQILETYLDPDHVSNGARVVINERTGTVIIGGDVQISPVLISHKGLTITTLTPQPEPTPINPQTKRSDFVIMDPERRGGTRLADLQAAFDQLKVEADDRIEIFKMLADSGYMHAQLIIR